MAGKRIADLGCLEGGYTVEFARMGFEALGIEVRRSNFAACEYVRAHLHLPNLHFARDDVWNIEKYGTFDAIFCSGLLYHLDRPIEFIKLISGLCRRLIILNTHVARETINPNFPLSDMTSTKACEAGGCRNLIQPRPIWIKRKSGGPLGAMHDRSGHARNIF